MHLPPRRFESIKSKLYGSKAEDLHLTASTSFLLTIRAATYIVTFLTGVILARTLGPDTRGAYGLATVLVAYAVYLDFGTSPAGVYLVSRHLFSLDAVASNGIALSAVMSCGWTVLMLAMAITRPAFIPDELGTTDFLILAAAGSCRILTVLCSQLAMANGRVLNTGLIEVTEPCLRALFILAALALFGGDLEAVLLAWLAAAAVTSALGLFLLSRGARLRARFQLPLSRQLCSFGLRTWTGGVVQAVNLRLDVFFVAAMLTAADLGHYAVAFGLAEMFWQVPMVAALVLFPKAAASKSSTNTELTAKTCRRMLSLTFAGVAAIILASPLLIALYGPDYRASLAPFLILAPSALLVSIYKILSSGLAAMGSPEAPLYGGIAAVPFMIGGSLLLIPAYGIIGAAVASMVAYSVNALVTLLLFQRRTGVPASSLLFLRRSDIPETLRSLRNARPTGSNAAA